MKRQDLRLKESPPHLPYSTSAVHRGREALAEALALALAQRGTPRPRASRTKFGMG